MEENFSLDNLLCSKSNEYDQHILKDAIDLTCCGHFICKTCKPNTLFKVKCSKCGEINNRDFKELKELNQVNHMIEINLPSLFTKVEKQTSEYVGKLKSLIDGHDEIIDVNFKYIEDEIEIRIESMKNELDDLFQQFRKKLADLKKETKEEKTDDFKVYDSKIKNYESNLSELRSLSNGGKLDKEQFYNHQDNLRVLKKEVKKLEDILDESILEFFPSNRKMDENLVGEIYFKKLKFNPKQFKEIIENKGYESKPTYASFFDSVCLPDDQLLCSLNGIFHLFDDKFNLIKAINIFDDKSYDILGLAYDEDNGRIYATDNTNHRIVMTDLEFNSMISFGSLGNESQNFNNPYGICFKNDRLYVCDHSNQRIQILNSDLQLFDTLKLEYKPYTIKIGNKTIGICGDKGTYFYDLDTKVIKNQYTTIYGRINEINSYFYVFSFTPKITLYVFDKNGLLLVNDEINIDRFSYFITNFYDAHITIMKKSLFITPFNSGRTFKFLIK